jgi:hypothetical protein
LLTATATSSLSLPASLANREPAMSTSFSDMAGEAALRFMVERGAARGAVKLVETGHSKVQTPSMGQDTELSWTLPGAAARPCKFSEGPPNFSGAACLIAYRCCALSRRQHHAEPLFRPCPSTPPVTKQRKNLDVINRLEPQRAATTILVLRPH